MEKENIGFNKSEHWKGVNAIRKNVQNKSAYVDKAMSAASNAFAELAEEAKDEADMLLRQIEELETLAKKVLKLFKSLPLNDIRIDNTKK